MRFFARTFAAFTYVVRKQMKAQTEDYFYSLTSLTDMSLSAFAHLKRMFKLSVTDEQCEDPDQIEQKLTHLNLLDFFSNHYLISFSKIIPAIIWIYFVGWLE